MTPLFTRNDLSDTTITPLQAANEHPPDRKGARAQSALTATENPFLYPPDLLEVAVRRSAIPSVADDGPAEVPEDGDNVSRWWLVHAKPRQEKKLAEQLLAGRIPHYLPVTKCTSMTRGRPRISLQPLFAGYLFLLGLFEQRRAALETNRIVATHRIKDEAQIARQLWDLADLIEKGVPLRIEERLASGQHVRVKSGLLKDKRGVVMKRVGKTRLFVFVNELLGGVSVEIEQHLLEPYG